jgi:hypothetical protein
MEEDSISVIGEIDFLDESSAIALTLAAINIKSS